MRISLKPIVPKRNPFKAGLYEQLMDAATREVTTGMLTDFKSTVATWQSKPRFGVTRRGTAWYISTKNDVYSYVNEGTRAHVIRPRMASRLVFFRTGFRAKTSPGVIGSGSGRRASRDLTFAKEVHHPGTKARNFSKQIKEKWARIWRDKMFAAIRKASRG